MGDSVFTGILRKVPTPEGWREKLGLGFVYFADSQEFGIKADGTDETVALQAFLDAAAGGMAVFLPGATYRYSTLTFPADTGIIARGVTFDRVAASTTHGITIEEGVSIDELTITTPGGTGGDRAIAIRGDGVTIEKLDVRADAEGAYDSSNWVVDIESDPSGTILTDITIRNVYTDNFSTFLFAKSVVRLTVDRVLCEHFRLAVYLKDVRNSELSNVKCRATSAACNGDPGENGLLIESSVENGSNNIQLTNWEVEDAGEHSYRLGGSTWAIDDIYFTNCVSRSSGSAILINNPGSTGWHGGCGFKVLGANTVSDQPHRNIFFNNCGVEDCSIDYGSYPSGHGVNNFTPFLIVNARNVHLTDCWTRAVDQSYVSRHGLLTANVDGLFLTNCNFRDVDLIALRPYEETPVMGYPGNDGPVRNFHVTGGLFEVTTATANGGIVLYVSEAADYDHANWTVNGATFEGGDSAVRFETVDAGSYEDIVLNFTYRNSNATDSTETTPVVNGGVYAFGTITAPWRPSASAPTLKNGSVYIDSDGTLPRYKTGGAWRTIGQTLGLNATATIASGVITITQPGLVVVDTESAASTDDLDTITFTGATDGTEITIAAANNARDVVVKDATGNMRTAGDFTLTHGQDTITLMLVGGVWCEKCRSDNTA